MAGESKEGWTVSRLATGEEISARATICATGVEYARLNLPNEERFLNRGLFYGAGPSEAALCTGHVYIVGGGNSSGQAALNFATHADRVTMLVRGLALKDTLSSYLVKRIESHGKIEVLTETTLIEVAGNDSLETITYRNASTGAEKTEQTQWLFICIGGVPRTDWAKPGTLAIDEAGYILTGEDLAQSSLPEGYWLSGQKPMFMEACMPGLFAAGDVRHNSIKRCATAVGEGATAVSMVHVYLGKLAAFYPLSVL